MAENSAISWTDHTFNPWIGCTRISPACDGCYAAALMGTEGRFGPPRALWGGPGKGEGTRSRTADSTWKQPKKWQRDAARRMKEWREQADLARLGGRPEPERPRPTFVFCSSLADVFDNAVPPEWRADLFDLIRATPHLTWLLLTKRPGNIVKLFREGIQADPSLVLNLARFWPRNAAIGATMVNQPEHDRDMDKLLAAYRALDPAFIFISDEPALGPMQLSPEFLALGPRAWVITGGETDQGAHKARQEDPAWYRSIRDQCLAAGVTYHHKQMMRGGPIPADLQIQDRPEVRRG